MVARFPPANAEGMNIPTSNNDNNPVNVQASRLKTSVPCEGPASRVPVPQQSPDVGNGVSQSDHCGCALKAQDLPRPFLVLSIERDKRQQGSLTLKLQQGSP